MKPIAKYWMHQFSLKAKSWAQYEEIDELENYLIEGCLFPENLISHTLVLFINSSFNHPKIQTLTKNSKETLMVSGLGTDLIEARGESLLTQIFTSLLLGDFVSYYLALTYQVDPSSRYNLDSQKSW
jgi:glucose/mannose-6-phosphate isomerase